jgi:uncharacterized protein YndB with AHSA1/START domain
MNGQQLEIKTSLKIQKPLREVFEGIADPVKMSNYFVSRSTGRIEAGKSLMWQFPESERQFPVRVDRVERDKYISWFWEDAIDKVETRVEISLLPMKDGVFVTVTEKERENDEAGIRWLAGNTAGWANFLACLKAYLEYGINLRRGAFDPSQLPKEVVA